jgi:hypothetical protein
VIWVWGQVVADADKGGDGLSEKEKDRERRVRTWWDEWPNDNFRWPAGEGSKPL